MRRFRSVEGGRKKTCSFWENKIKSIDFKDYRMLARYITERAKIVPRRTSGTCAKPAV